MFHSDGYDHLEEDHWKQGDISMEETLVDRQQDHSWDTHTTEEAHLEEAHLEGDHQYPFPQPQSYLSRTCSFIRFSELESLSVDMIRWLVT
jgi:hypothetical protein